MCLMNGVYCRVQGIHMTISVAQPVYNIKNATVCRIVDLIVQYNIIQYHGLQYNTIKLSLMTPFFVKPVKLTSAHASTTRMQ